MVRVALLLVLAVLASPSSGIAQEMAIQVDTGGYLTGLFHITTGVPFTVVTTIDTDGKEFTAAEWVQTELLTLAPGIFKLSTVANCSPCEFLGDASLGEYLMYWGYCAPPSEGEELLRITYGDVGGLVPIDTVMEIRGVQGGDTRVSSFDGSPGFADCSEGLYAAPMDDRVAFCTVLGNCAPEGGCMLNPAFISATGEAGISTLKAQFR